MDTLRYKSHVALIFLAVLLIASSSTIYCMESVNNLCKGVVTIIGSRGQSLVALHVKTGICALLEALRYSAFYCSHYKQLKDFELLSQDNSVHNTARAGASPLLDIAQKMELSADDIYVANFGSATATVPSFYGYKIVISPEDSRILTSEEMIAILGHELAHIKGHDLLKGICASLAMTTAIELSLAAGLSCGLRFNKNQADIIIYPCRSLLSSFLYTRYCRSQEKRADILSARCGNAQALIDALQKLEKNDFPENSFTSFIRREFIDSHPTLKERISYLSPIAQEQAAVNKARQFERKVQHSMVFSTF